MYLERERQIRDEIRTEREIKATSSSLCKSARRQDKNGSSFANSDLRKEVADFVSLPWMIAHM